MKCERCNKNRCFVSYYKRYNKFLCDECVDTLDGTKDMNVYENEEGKVVVEFPINNVKRIR